MYKLITIILIITLFVNGIKSNNINKILKDNFNHKEFEYDQTRNLNKVKDLINQDNGNFYLEIYETFTNYNSEDSSGSGQNKWNGETCQQTTFNWTQTTNCLNDCYEIWGQGKCNQVTNQCECNYFYTGEDCSINFNPERNWDIMPCNGGRYCPPIYNTPQQRRCYCPPGQEGLECNICSTSSSCNALMNDPINSYTCDNSPYVYNQKNYSCVITSNEVNEDLNNSTASTSFYCNFEDPYNSTCTMDFYYHQTGTPLYFNCSFYECTRQNPNGSSQSIICERSECDCTTYCSFFLAGIISDVSGPAQFNCSSIDQSFSTPFNCTFSQQEIRMMLPIIPLSCHAGECLSSNSTTQPPTSPPTPSETCQQTTFNWTQTTNCLNDCYEIWGQGSCDQVTNQCECTTYYTGEDCSINIDPNYDWDIMPCNGGRYCPPIYNAGQQRHCYCPPGQEGLECNICSTSSSCNGIMNDPINSYTCDSSHIVYNQKNYSCIVANQENNDILTNSSTSFSCSFENNDYNNQTGQCSMNMYNSLTGTPLYFNCTFSECDRDITNGNQTISCQTSQCSCTSYCSEILKGFISFVKSPAKFLCSQSSLDSAYQTNCLFSQVELSSILPTIELSCDASECLNNNLPI